jgi:hypothetical protein
VGHDEAPPLHGRQRKADAYQALVTCHRCSRRRRGREPANHSAWRRVLVSDYRATTLRCVCGRWEGEVLAYGVAAVRVEEFEDALHAHVALAIALPALHAYVHTRQPCRYVLCMYARANTFLVASTLHMCICVTHLHMFHALVTRHTNKHGPLHTLHTDRS